MTAHDLARESITQGALQKPWELAALINLVMELKPRRIVEIGSDTGGTLYGWARIATPAGVYSIDLPDGQYGTHREFHDWGVSTYRGDSHHGYAKDALMRWLRSNPIDFLFIDGDHTYQGAMADWEMYSPLVRMGGLVALHDICWHGPGEVQVDRVWQEIAGGGNGTTIELIQTPTNWGGIGVIRK